MVGKTPAKRIQFLMTSKGLTAAEMARRSSVSPTAVGLWLNGSVPRPKVLARVASVLGVSEDYILTGVTAPTVSTKLTVKEITAQTEADLADAMGYPRGTIRVRFEVIDVAA